VDAGRGKAGGVTATTETQRRDELVERLFGATLGTLELFGVYLGDRLGLYAALAEAGALDSDELARQTGIAPRYAREWLEQQAVAGILDVEPGDDSTRRYRLPPEYAPVLVEPESEFYVAPFAALVTGIGGALPEVTDAYRSGGGVSFGRYGPDLRGGQAAINRPAFTHEMASWIATMPDVDARLRSEPSARVADVGCGVGWSTLALARGFPTAWVEGIDLDEASIEDARRNAAGAGMADAVTFEVRDAADPATRGAYHLACMFEALHDTPRPVEVLAALREMLRDDGSVLVADEQVADSFTAPGDEMERMMYGWSISHCLPAAMVDQPAEPTGTVLRAPTLRDLAARAGFGSVEVLPIENDFFRFYRLRP
jgi:2-polyprenyl-3-methyl-5-hydroxy-6-metoxy-1,4-benzoquinol methylase